MPSGPKFIRFFWPILKALRDLGGSARPREVVDLVVEMLGVSDDERAEAARCASTTRFAGRATTWSGPASSTGTKRGWWQLSNAG